MQLKSMVAGFLALAAVPLTAVGNVLPEDAFWNKDTAYVPAAPATSAAVALESGTFEFTSVWDLVLTFTSDFRGVKTRGTVIIIH